MRSGKAGRGQGAAADDGRRSEVAARTLVVLVAMGLVAFVVVALQRAAPWAIAGVLGATAALVTAAASKWGR